MKHILLIYRHAKSDWSHQQLADYDRPLTDRGRFAAKAMGSYMRKIKLSPDLILCSTAARAQQTLLLTLEQLGWEKQVQLAREFYLAKETTLLAALTLLDETIRSVMLIGHEPGLTNLTRMLAKTANHKTDMKNLCHKFPTAALAEIEFTGSWADLRPDNGILTKFIRPRDLMRAIVQDVE